MEQGSVEGAIRAVLGLGNTVLERDQNSGWTRDTRHDAAVFSYRRDFDSLWNLNPGAPGLETIANRLKKDKRKDKAFTLVIIWDGDPDGKTGAVNTSRYITPLDWAVALSLTIHQLSPDPKGCPALRIIVVDPASHRADYADCLSLLPHLRLALPWIAFYQPAERAPGSVGIDQLFLDIIDAGGKLAGGVPTMSDAVKSGHSDPELIRRIWASFLSKPSTRDDHHAIANLLGPQLLLGETARATDATVQALRSVMLTAGLLPSEAESNREALLTDKAYWKKPDMHPAWKTTIEKLADGRLKLILVDDQWQDGWGEVLCKAIGVGFNEKAKSEDGSLIKISQATGNISIHAASSPNVILEKLEQSCEDTCKDRRFTLRLDDSESNAAEILFLDLRLFSGNSASGEADFIERCLKLARRMMADHGARLPWAGFSEDELGRIENWIIKTRDPNSGDTREMPEYAEALTLFSRIIAQADLSLPIVLFTSTGRRDIMKAFDGYGSIICEFEKPRLSGGPADDLAARAKEQFKSAITRAMEMLDARLLCKGFLDFPPMVRKETSTSPRNGHWTIDLYVDESGSEIDKKTDLPAPGGKLTVGGLLVIFAPGSDPDSFNGALLRKMQDIIDFKQVKDTIKQGLRNNAEGLSDWVLNEPNGNKPEHVSLVTLSGIMPDPKDGDESSGYLDLNHVGDNLHRDLMAQVVDFAIYHHSLRVIPSSDEVSCRIHLPTRVLPPRDSRHSDDLFNTLGIPLVYVGEGRALYEARDSLDKLGTVPKIVAAINTALTGFPESPKKIRYFNFDAARPLVQSVANHYKHAFFRPRMDHARAYGVNDFWHAGKPGGPKALHLLMDAVLSATHRGSAIEQIIRNGASGIMDPSMRTMAYAARLYAAGHFAETLAAMADLSAHHAAKDVVADILGGEIRDATERINGLGYMSFIDIRKERMGYGKSANMTQNSLKGRVLRKEEFFDVISDGVSGECKYYRDDDQKSLGVGDKVIYDTVRGYIPGERNVTNILVHTPHPVWNMLKAQRIFIGRVFNIKADRQYVEVELCGLRGDVKVRKEYNSSDIGKTIYFKSALNGTSFTGEEIIFANDADFAKAKLVTFGRITGVNNDGGFVSLSSPGMQGMIHHSKMPHWAYGKIDAHLQQGEDVMVEVCDASLGVDKPGLKLLHNLTRWYTTK